MKLKNRHIKQDTPYKVLEEEYLDRFEDEEDPHFECEDKIDGTKTVYFVSKEVVR